MKEEQLKIYVFSKVKFHEILTQNNINDENVDEFTNLAMICINDTSGEYYHDPLFIGSHHNVLTLFFDDVENDFELSPTNNGKTRAFTKEDAKKIIEFLSSNKNVNTLLIHCAGGISRSGAVGLFALDFLRGDKDSFKINNSHIVPNAKVSLLLNQESRKWIPKF